MGNCYTTHAMLYPGIPMTEDDAKRLNAIIIADDLAKEEMESENHCVDCTGCELSVEWELGYGMLKTSGESSSIEACPPELFTELGKLIEQAGKKYATVEFSHHPPGGGELRIYTDGTVEYPERVYTHEVATTKTSNVGGSILPSHNVSTYNPVVTKFGTLQVIHIRELDTHFLVLVDDDGKPQRIIAEHPNGHSCKAVAARVRDGDVDGAKEQIDFIIACGGMGNKAIMDREIPELILIDEPHHHE